MHEYCTRYTYIGILYTTRPVTSVFFLGLGFGRVRGRNAQALHENRTEFPVSSECECAWVNHSYSASSACGHQRINALHIMGVSVCLDAP